MGLRPVRDNTKMTAVTSAVGTGTPQDADYTTTISNQNGLNNDLFNNLFLGASPIYGDHFFQFSVPLYNILVDKPILLDLLGKPLVIEIDTSRSHDTYFTQDGSNRINEIYLYNLTYNITISYIPNDVSDILFPNNEAILLGTD